MGDREERNDIPENREERQRSQEEGLGLAHSIF
jgi:hypothetical protein